MTVRPERPQSLGRGLASLIPQRHAGQPAPTEIPTDRIRSNPYQPRHHMDEAALATLTASIAEHGVVQPILVTEMLDGYQLVAGERRLRAAIAAGLDRIPAVVRQLADSEQLELALVENLQREDLDPIEAALAYRQLIDVFGYSHEAVATRVGRARTTVANTLRLLDLDPAVQTALASGEITEGHARALGGLAPEAQGRVLGTRHRAGALGPPDRGAGAPAPRTEAGRRPEAAAARRSRPRPGRGGPPPRARHQGQPRALAQGRPHRHRVLQRRRTGASLRAPDRRERVTEEAASQPPVRTPPPRARKGKAGGSDYTAESIQVLEGLEAVRRRPGMYIGSTDERGLHHLVWEVVDNSIDEAMAGFAHKILVTIKADGMVVVQDDGRGVPVGKHSTGKDALEVVHTVLHAGGKFGGGGYKVSGGLHGVGVSVVNALSEWMRVETARDKFVWAQEYERGKPKGPVKKIGPQGTRVGHHDQLPRRSRRCSRPSTTRSRRISQRLRESAYLNKGVWITFIDERNDRERSFYFEGGLQSFVRHLNRNKEALTIAADLRRPPPGLAPPSRSPSSTTTPTPRTSWRSPTTSTPRTAGPTSPGSAPR